MELRDFIVTPIIILLVYVLAYNIRPWVTDEFNRVYFFPALTMKIIGALALGFIYQFYYSGGDTYNFHTHGSRHIWEAFVDSPEKGFKLLFNDGTDVRGVYKYASKIPFYTDKQSYAVIRLAAVFDLLTFSSYSATAVLFSLLSFIGMWMFFLTFYDQYPHLHRGFAVASFFIPSVIFWGSGLMKDTVTLACLGACTYLTYRIFIQRRFFIQHMLLLLLTLYGLYLIKIYILLTFLPAAILWVAMMNFVKIRVPALKILIAPFVITAAIVLAYVAMIKAGEENPKYSIKKLAETATVTAYDIRYWTGKEAGSGYTLGELDGSFNSMLRLTPQAINVSLFRPYLWEVKNPLMLLSALESLAFFFGVMYLLIRRNRFVFTSLTNPNILFGIIFSLTFAFAVGVSTYNFGTLMRYKIPMLPVFVVALIMINDYAKSRNTLVEFETTE